MGEKYSIFFVSSRILVIRLYVPRVGKVENRCSSPRWEGWEWVNQSSPFRGTANCPLILISSSYRRESLEGRQNQKQTPDVMAQS